MNGRDFQTSRRDAAEAAADLTQDAPRLQAIRGDDADIGGAATTKQLEKLQDDLEVDRVGSRPFGSLHLGGELLRIHENQRRQRSGSRRYGRRIDEPSTVEELAHQVPDRWCHAVLFAEHRAQLILWIR